MQSAAAVQDALLTLGRKRQHLQRAYRLLFNPNLYRQFAKVDARLALPSLIEALRSQTFRWGGDAVQDRALAEVLAGIIGACLTGRGPGFVHGLAPDTGLHSALRAARAMVAGVQWVTAIAAPMSDLGSGLQFKPKLSHMVRDGRFTELLSRYFDVYPVADPESSTVFSGVLQPASLHGVCAQLALTDLDDHLESTRTVLKHKRDGTVLKSLRYSNALLLAASGSRDTAEALLAEVTAVLRSLTGDDAPGGREPRWIPWRTGSDVQFLGYRMQCRDDGFASLRSSPELLRKVARPFHRRGKPAERGDRTFLDDHRIGDLYAEEFEAVRQYYALAEDRGPLRGFQQTLKASWARTLAHKHRCRVNTVLDPQGGHLAVWEGSWLAKIPGTDYRVNRIEDVCIREREQVRAGEPCAVKVARTVRREANHH
jgi:hypothetical protein